MLKKCTGFLALFVATMAYSNCTFAQANDQTGLTLGVKLYKTQYGYAISDFLPGYERNTRALNRRDIIKAITVRGRIMKTTTLQKLREAKALVGPGQYTVMQIWRPNHGYMYPEIRYTADSGGVTYSTVRPQSTKSRTYFKNLEKKSGNSSSSGSSSSPGVFPPE